MSSPSFQFPVLSKHTPHAVDVQIAGKLGACLFGNVLEVVDKEWKVGLGSFML